MPIPNWLEETEILQVESFGFDFEDLRQNPDELADYLAMMHLAAIDELSESLAEVAWKPWSKKRGEYNKERVVDELVDVLHFVGNIAVALEISDDEVKESYQNKMRINRERMATNYTQRGF